MIDPKVFEDPRVVVALLVAGAGLIAIGAWLLGRPRGAAAWADEIGELAWVAIRHVRRVFVMLASVTLALVGAALLVLPGPGTLFLAAALGLLATEFVWARRWIRKLQRRLGALSQEARGILEGRWGAPSVPSSAGGVHADRRRPEGRVPPPPARGAGRDPS
ncbi:MAG: PGPGW domain-containing protein [Deltaproteobacteria bacterium]|jgi:hypothetical protein|nr:PGPGW domain-containing protein [Deltaproteobacteria bacterium]MBW2500948.1 PGPGW domain-containing protein [Deltaproteobacteria bacterium]